MFRKDMLKKLFVVAVLVSLLWSDVGCVFHVVEPAYAAAKKKSMKKKSAKTAPKNTLIEYVRNNLYHNAYSASAGYRPVGRQLERFFTNGRWSTEKQNSENYGSQLAVFSGIGVVNGRRVNFKVKFGQKTDNGQIVLQSVYMNDKRVYDHGVETYSAYMDMSGFESLLGFMSGYDTKNSLTNEFTLRDFMDYIYSRE